MFKFLSPKRTIKMGPAPTPPPIDCNALISTAIDEALSNFNCASYEASPLAYAISLGVCDSVTGDCPACLDDVVAAMAVYYANNCE